jgi:hypothetical protein
MGLLALCARRWCILFREMGWSFFVWWLFLMIFFVWWVLGARGGYGLGVIFFFLDLFAQLFWVAMGRLLYGLALYSGLIRSRVGIFFVGDGENAAGFFRSVLGQAVLWSGVDGTCLHVNTRHMHESDAVTSALVCFELFATGPLILWR